MSRPLPEPSLSQLALFVRLAEAGSLTAAAREQGLTPAAASASLQRLEVVYGQRLVERSTRSMRLTAEGELLREHAARALAELDELRGRLGQRQARLEGEVHLAVPSDLGREVLSPMLDAFCARHPALRLVWHLSDGYHDLRRERVDLALRYGPLPDSTLVARRLAVGERVPVASPAYLARCGTPRTPQDLAQHNALTMFLGGRPQQHWTLLRDGQPVQVRVNGNRRADDGGLVRQWAVQGLGIALKSMLDVAADLRAGRLVRLLPDWAGERIALQAVLPAAPAPLRVRRLVDALAEGFAALEAGGATVPAPPAPADR
ncbi:LysR family transcriptional regulator [Piscinibacter sakaiensis]|uniref:Transcriptional regulator, LysR family n=1 Tax=Piscinibacter sakaiensis TaxID=1547922 RepID=A0A0K8P2S4_PISS1|nr:LysR family transcriptional regulator [Piscinibacter sakaiensis]GAP36475.1 transcriptional regulator, LysR family [Piscinibacter sakaiensis]